ncbi:fungal hydrophobin [Trametes coccinea BRFM310]|uniref:Hydrophobin n=1 Tax=Trametes coccinea (strain BRFM310) TaxID=1353009 RepID=A0A1Y2ILY7_TRAC3|nr:fungal hydrophobin [Trametes coccinea BRFM310]
MFARLAAIAALALPALVVAQSCNTGAIQCCNSLQSATDPDLFGMLAVLGVVVEDLDVLVGLGCTPITVVGVGAAGSCDAHPVCCENNSLANGVSIGCVPVDIS